MTLLSTPDSSTDAEDSIVCYCYRLTTRDLKQAYEKYGCLKKVEEATRAGTGCTGCKVLLHSLFEEIPSDQYGLVDGTNVGPRCVKPGRNTQKGFVIANGELESTVYAANTIAPQLGNCDTSTELEYSVVNHRGEPVIIRKTTLKTNETFCFDTRKENLPRPFYGMFLLSIARSNLGAARFNIYWSNGKSTTATHENAATGRPRVFLPVVVNKRFLSGPNRIWIATMNPHHREVPVTFSLLDLDSSNKISWESSLEPYASIWIDGNELLYAPALKRYPEGNFVLRVESTLNNIHTATSSYFFLHNTKTDLWTSNHL